jgi:hypothetical protein
MITKEQHELGEKLEKEGTESIKKTEIYEDFIKQSCGSESPKTVVDDLIRRLNLANRWMAWSQTEERTKNLINRYAMDGQRLTKELNGKLGRNKYKTILNKAGNGFLIVENKEKWDA